MRTLTDAERLEIALSIMTSDEEDLFCLRCAEAEAKLNEVHNAVI